MMFQTEVTKIHNPYAMTAVVVAGMLLGAMCCFNLGW